MSETFKTKYEVSKLIRENILKGLAAFGLPIRAEGSTEGWDCIESDQPSFKNENRIVTFYLENVERIGWQGYSKEYDKDTDTFTVTDNWIELQTWKVNVLLKRKDGPTTTDNITTNDVASMLIAWFNRLGVVEFRKHYCANFFIQLKELHNYKGTADVPQWTSSFPLKLQVPKMFATDIPPATPQLEAMIGV